MLADPCSRLVAEWEAIVRFFHMFLLSVAPSQMFLLLQSLLRLQRDELGCGSSCRYLIIILHFTVRKSEKTKLSCNHRMFGTVECLALNMKSNPVDSLQTAETQRGVGASKSKRVSEGDPRALSGPRLGPAGNVVQAELGFCAVQIERWGQYPVVAGQSGEGCLQGACGSEQMSRGSFGRGHGQTVRAGLEEPLDGCIFSGVP